MPDPSGAARAPQDLTELLAEVKAALQQATPGPWALGSRVGELPPDATPEWTTAQGLTVGFCGLYGRGQTIMSQWSGPSYIRPADEWLLVNAPEWLGALVQAVEDQQRERERLDRVVENWITKYGELVAEVAQLRADGQRLRQALESLRDAGQCCEAASVGKPCDSFCVARGALAPPRDAP